LLVKRLNTYGSGETGKVQKLGKEDWEFIWKGGGFLWDEMHREEGLAG
jgi:hypothetical protein